MPFTLAPGVACPTVADVFSITVSLASFSKVLFPGGAGTWLAGATVWVAIVASSTHFTIGAHCIVSAILRIEERLVCL